MTDLTDKVLTCATCKVTFLFTADEQEFFREKRFINEPRHCLKCRVKKASGSIRPHQFAEVICADCGHVANVPFNPRQGRPVYCRGCFTRDHNPAKNAGLMLVK